MDEAQQSTNWNSVGGIDMRVIITGGTGLIGSALAASLVADQHDVVILTRDAKQPAKLPASVQLVEWDASSAAGWAQYADGADAIVNLAGEGIADSRWSDERKKRIYASRVNAGRAVMEAIRTAKTKPRVLVQASGVDYYGPHGDESITEADPPGRSFLAQVCFDWEASTAAAASLGVRRPIIRSGIVLSNQGGAWPRIVLPFKFFVGGPLGNGKQVWPWIHLTDEIRAIRFLIDHPSAEGPFNLCTAQPLTNKEFAQRLGQVMRRPALMPVPSLALRAVFGEMADVLLEGRRTLPQRLQELGFSFDYPTAEAAFSALLQ
jgi:uncharacterized protein (TIGR01777 family)